MARGVQKAKILLAILATCASIWLVYWLFFSLGSDLYSPEEINDMFQGKDASVEIRKVELQQQAIRVPYLDKGTLHAENWVLSGDIVVKNDQYIRLTSNKEHQVGNMFSKWPIQAESFEMELTFHVHGGHSNGMLADGFAVWFLDKPSPIGDVFGAQNNFKGLGIFVDTYRNGPTGHFPYVNAQFGDGKSSYNRYTDGLDTKLAGCTVKSIVNPGSGVSRMRIIHTKNGYLSVDFNYDPDHSDEWHNCFTLSDITLPVVKYLGITAETGQLTEYVDIIENKLYALFQPNSDRFLESVHQLEDLIEQQLEQSEPKKRESRKSLIRLKKAEERLKQRERALREEKYGDPDATFVRRWWRRTLTAAKFVVYVILAALIVWVAAIVYRVQKQKKRSRTTGLLD